MRRQTLALGGASLVVPAFAAVFVLAMYVLGPTIALAAIVGAVGVAVVAWRPIFGVYGALLTVPLEVFGIRFGRATITFAELVLLGTAAVAAVHLVLGDRIALKGTHLGFLALIAVALTGFFFAEDTAVIVRITRVWVAYWIIMVYISRSETRDLVRVMLALAVTGGLCGLAAVLNSGSQQVIAGGEIVTGRAQTGFAQPNVLGFFLLLTLPSALVLIVRGPPWRRIAIAACAVANFAGLILTLSRSSIIGTVCALSILLAWARFRRVFLAVLVVLLAVVAVNFDQISKRPEVSVVATRLSTLGKSSGVGEDPRIGIWKVTPGIIADHFALGTGEGNFPVVSPRYGILDPGSFLAYDHAHDTLLTITAELGLIGLAVFLTWIGAIAKAARAALRQADDEWPLVLAVVASLCGLFVCGLFDYPPRTNVIMATILILVGLLSGFRRASEARAAADA